jgi:hypothetical protein
MDQSLPSGTTSVFDGSGIPHHYRTIGFAIIGLVAIGQLAAFLIGTSLFTQALALHDGTVVANCPHVFAIALVIYPFICLSAVIGIIIRRKAGLILTAATTYYVIGTFSWSVWPNFPVAILIACIVFCVPAALMHTSHCRRFYKVHDAGFLFVQHSLALLIAVTLVALQPYALGWDRSFF